MPLASKKESRLQLFGSVLDRFVDEEDTFSCSEYSGVRKGTEDSGLSYADRMNGEHVMVIVVKKGRPLSDEDKVAISDLMHKLTEDK